MRLLIIALINQIVYSVKVSFNTTSCASVPASSTIYLAMMQDVIINADLWSDKPEILSASYGFDGILGIPDPFNERTVRNAGGAWDALICNKTLDNGMWQFLPDNMTSSADVQQIINGFGFPSYFGDGIPVVFSWPVLPSSVHRSAFEIELNNGDVIMPDAVSIYPNQDYNERNTVVLVSPAFGNRLYPYENGALYPTKVRIVNDQCPFMGESLMLVGPDGPVSAVGLSWNNTGHPYISGPRLCGAKLSRMNAIGDDGPPNYGVNFNDGISLYGERAQYRLRLLTTGGFTPDGVLGLRPNMFESFFKVRVTLSDGEIRDLDHVDKEYIIEDGYRLTIVGLAELGVHFSSTNSEKYDDCYLEDKDNQIDIILEGDEEAVKLITHVVIPSESEEGYLPFYNPGGPGLKPDVNTRYTAPSPSSVQNVSINLDDPKTVTYFIPLKEAVQI